MRVPRSCCCQYVLVSTCQARVLSEVGAVAAESGGRGGGRGSLVPPVCARRKKVGDDSGLPLPEAELRVHSSFFLYFVCGLPWALRPVTSSLGNGMVIFFASHTKQFVLRTAAGSKRRKTRDFSTFLVFFCRTQSTLLAFRLGCPMCPMHFLFVAVFENRAGAIVGRNIAHCREDFYSRPFGLRA